MGKGKSKARRQRNAAEAAAEKLSATGLLPEKKRRGAMQRSKKRKGPQAASEYDGMPRKLRELMRLKEFAERSNEESSRSRDQGGDDEEDDDQQDHQGADSDDDSRAYAGDPGGAGAENRGGAAAAAAAAADGGQTERGGEQQAKRQGGEADADADGSPKQQKGSRELAPVAAAAARKPKASKLRAKEWKKQKKLKQAMKKIGPVGEFSDSDEDVSESKPADKVRFGEQAQMPPEFSLKQKTWTSEQQAKRCTAIFERQMEEAKNAARQQTSVPNVGMMNAQDATLRLQLIDGYRSARKNQAVQRSKNKSDRGPATLQSLKALVKAAANSNNGDKGE